MSRLVAELAVETGIAPSELIGLDRHLLMMLVDVLEERAEKAQNAIRNRRVGRNP